MSQHIVIIYILAFAAGLIASFVSLPFWRRFCLRTDLIDDPGHRKIHDESIPLAGGLAVFTGLIVPLLGALVLTQLPVLPQAVVEPLLYGLKARGWQLAALMTGAVGMLLIGVADDKWELSAGKKFCGQLLIAALVAFSGIRITLFVPNLIFSYIITVLWILTVVNAFNFMDNMNGLCSGLGTIAAWIIGLLGASAGHYLIALLSFMVAGALIGFLPHNFPKARAFLGDGGSHLVGFLLATLTILPHFHTPENPRVLAVFTPLLVLFVPLADLVSVVIIRWKHGKPFYIGDNNHLSHRLVRGGLSRTQAVVWIWVLAAGVGALSLVLR